MIYASKKLLVERHAGIVKKLADMHARIEAEDRGLTPDEKTQWDALCDESSDLESRIETAQQLETASSGFKDEELEHHDRQMFEDRKRTSADPEQRPLTPLEGSRAFRAWAMGDDASLEDQALARRAGLHGKAVTLQPRFMPNNRRPRTVAEIDALYSGESRGTSPQSVGTVGLGGYTVQDELMRAIDIALLAWGNVRAAATVITTATGGPLPIPTVNDTASVGAVLAENTQVTVGDITFAQLVLNAFKYSSKSVLVSVELMQDSTVNLPAFIGERLGERIARITNQHYTTGAGTTVPFGLTTRAVNSGITTASATAVTWAEMIDTKHSVDVAYRRNASWMMDDVALSWLKKQVESTYRPMWQPDMSAASPGTYDGDPIIVNNDMPTAALSKAILYGDFSKYIVREVAGITVLRLDERYADYHQVGFLAFSRSDGDLLNAAAGPVKYLSMHA